MDERESARAEINDSRERMKDIAAQLARRADPTYVKERAKEVAVDKSIELKDRIIDSPLAWGIMGGLATAGIAAVVRNQQSKRADMPYDYEGLEGEEGGLGGKVQEAKGQLGQRLQETKSQLGDKVGAVREQAGHLKDQARHRVSELREHMPSAHEMKDKARQVGARARGYASEEPLVTALGALAIGAALGFLLPLTSQERRALGPAREQVSEKLGALSHEVSDKVQAKVDEVREKIAGDSPTV
jgi:ElaB/YqjD/DUF883 family membrane-anchored ribosome-binding protein